MLNSVVGVVSPLLGGVMMGAVGSGYTPHVAVILHAALACVLLHILPVGMDVLQTSQSKQVQATLVDQAKSKAKRE